MHDLPSFRRLDEGTSAVGGICHALLPSVVPGKHISGAQGLDPSLFPNPELAHL